MARRKRATAKAVAKKAVEATTEEAVEPFDVVEDSDTAEAEVVVKDTATDEQSAVVVSDETAEVVESEVVEESGFEILETVVTATDDKKEDSASESLDGKALLGQFRKTADTWQELGIETEIEADELVLKLVKAESTEIQQSVEEALEKELSSVELIDRGIEYRVKQLVRELDTRVKVLGGSLRVGSKDYLVEKEQPLEESIVARVKELTRNYKANIKKVILDKAVLISADDVIEGNGIRNSQLVWIDKNAAEENKRACSMEIFRNMIFRAGSFEVDGEQVEFDLIQQRPKGSGIHNTLRVLNSEQFDLFESHVNGSMLWKRICEDPETEEEHTTARQSRLTNEDLFDISRLVCEKFPWMNGHLSRPSK